MAIRATAAGFATANQKSPARCVATLTAVTNVGGNVEPDSSNNSTNLVIDVVDHTDF
ncbi:MAG TPA: hypothetical protein VMT89_12535 [Candidatus Acidoferrales bacterium]|nr:hypothetical protein [Candidatus Acidoferrales bacterium]